jgi:hypothetical protein
LRPTRVGRRRRIAVGARARHCGKELRGLSRHRSDRGKFAEASAAVPRLALEQDRFGLDHFSSTATWRPKRESCSIHRFESRYPVENLAEALAEGIVTGHSAMPEFTFKPDEIDALLTYIASLGPGAPPKAKP